MKATSRPFFTSASARRRQRGMALILVLGIIVLLTILVIGFMVRAGSERSSSANYRVTASVQQLAESAVNLVQGQINHATTQSSSSKYFAWASQPGAIRLYNADGSLNLIYRLYSAKSLTTTSADDPITAADALPTGDVPPSTWSTSPVVWTDLNAPVTSSNTTTGTKLTSYPILDVRDPADASGSTLITDAGNPHAMEGFSIANVPGSTTLQPVPMPVQWLYVLQNGQIITPDSGASGTSCTFNSATPKPTTANPIVGRIAFWTDDDTCKVNINTASAGTATFWDSPRFQFGDERNTSGSGLALYQPTKGEYQRYPGHPATTTLNKVFASIAPTITSNSTLFGFFPRYTWGGSTQATVPITAASNLTQKLDRLYSSVGELLFNTARTTNGLTRQQLETGKFFLTAHSRAPEINLFGKPRVAIWPISDTNDSSHRTAIDQLIAFSATTNATGTPYAYYFTRKDNTSATTDVGLSRNASLLTFLDTEMSTAIPGFGGDFNTKYGSDQPQILTEIFDYIRATNLRDSTVQIPYADVTGTPLGTPSNNAGAGQVIPSTRSSTQGVGRFARISEASLLFIGMGRGPTTGNAALPTLNVDPEQTPAPPSGYIPPADTTDVQAFLLLSFFDPAMGYSRMNPAFTVNVSWSGDLVYDGQAMGMGSGSLYVGGTPSAPISTWISAPVRSGMMDFRSFVANRQLGSSAATQFPFYSHILEIPSSHTGPLFKGTTATITVSAGNGGATIQTYTIKFPAVQLLPLPGVEPDSATGVNHRRFGSTAYANTSYIDRVSMYTSQANLYTLMINPTYDRVMSMVPTIQYADYRLLSIANVPVGAFQLHPSEPPTGTNFAYGMRTSAGTLLTNAIVGQMVAGVTPSVAGTDGTPARPDAVPATVNGAFIGGGTTGIPGDWDNSVGDIPDGPYINKADEGSIYIDPTGTMPYWSSGNFGTTAVGPTFFSANRQIPSPVMFGSLPTGVQAHKPWQTLLFQPGRTGHPGLSSPEDHLLLDLFWMPVAEPYAISEPFSTAGKVNMNYQIVPFTYITRNTALRSVLASEKVAAIPYKLSAYYKTDYTKTIYPAARYALNLSDVDGTLRQFKEKFASKDIFRSASEICDIYMVPLTLPSGAAGSWTSNTIAQSQWYDMSSAGQFTMVGDNTRERPYADVYPRLTTKSNVYTVYYTAQTLKSPSTVNAASWDETKGTITGEYRGSTTLERYIDPNNNNIPDYATNPSAALLDTFYKWRIVANNQFAP